MELLHLSLKSWLKIALTLSAITIFLLWMITDGGTYVKFKARQYPASVVSRQEVQRHIPLDTGGEQGGEKSRSKPSVNNFTVPPNILVQDSVNKISSFERQTESLDLETVNADRVKTLRSHCKTLDKPIFLYKDRNSQKITPRHFGHLYVNDRYKFIHCFIPKVASTNFKRLFLGLAGVERPFSVPGFDIHERTGKFFSKVRGMSLSDFSPKEIAHRLQTYTKAIVVRDPLERILSAYRNKIGQHGQDYFIKTYGSKIMQKYHPDLPQELLSSGRGVSFQDFVRYLLHPMDFPYLKPRFHMNEHWERYFALCQPCFVRYNVVAKYETLDDDVQFILSKINASNMMEWPKRQQHYNRTPTAELLGEAYKDIPPEDMRALWMLYYDDFKMFGYNFQSRGRENVSLPSNDIIGN